MTGRGVSSLSSVPGGVAPGADGLDGLRPDGAVSVIPRRFGGDCGDDGRLTTLQRHAGRAMARRLLDGIGLREHRLRRCGYSLGPGRTFKVGGDGRVRSAGVERCANARVCPVCGPAAAAVRGAEIGAAVWRWLDAEEENGAIFVSIAASHRPSDKLADLHDQLLVARAAVMRSDDETYRRFRRRFGIIDVAWKAEHSFGTNGPHPGLHAIFLVDRPWSAVDAQRAEAWLVVRFRAELAAAGFQGRLSSEHGVDLRPVDDPRGAGAYLAKWGIGAELAGEAAKLGRNIDSMPYGAIPSVLAHDLGRRDPYRMAERDPGVRRLVEAWGEFVTVALGDRRHWYRGFRRLNDLVPELRGITRPVERIAIAVEVLPPELRPPRHDDAEEDDAQADEGRPLLIIDSNAWAAAQATWFRPDRVPPHWHQRRWRWLDGRAGPLLPLELATAWVAEDEGLAAAAGAVAELCGAVVVADDRGLVVRLLGV